MAHESGHHPRLVQRGDVGGIQVVAPVQTRHHAPRAVRQRVDFHPLLNPFASPALHGLTQSLLRRDPSNPRLAKAEGMLRFHVEGKRCITEQNWPKCLQSLVDAGELNLSAKAG